MVKALKVLGYLLLILAMISCASQRQEHRESHIERDTIVKESVRVDTVFIDRVVEKNLPVFQDFTLNEPCDSLGTLKPFMFSFGSGANTGSLSSENNILKLSFKLDSIVNRFEKQYHSRYVLDSLKIRKELKSEFESSSKTVKTVWPWWLYVLIIYFVLSLASHFKGFLN